MTLKLNACTLIEMEITKSDRLKEFQERVDPTGSLFEVVPFLPKIYINSFPKSGTHFANLICAHLAQRQEPKYWMGNFKGNSWTTRSVADDQILPIIEGQEPRTWYQGHLGYKSEYDEAFQEKNVCMVFIYRDLRDVAISQAYHIELADGVTKMHPGKDLFMKLGSHRERIRAVIEGLQEYAGLFERWELYAPWLGCEWILPIRYEDLHDRTKETARQVIEYVIRRTLKKNTYLLSADSFMAAVEKSVDLLNDKSLSGSYRKGSVGEWEKEFDKELKEVFKRADQNRWLERLGYEKSNSW